MADRSLDGQAALVTGGSRGIGKATALQLARAGARVAISYRSRKEDAESVCGSIKQEGSEGFAIEGDMAEAAVPARLVEEVIRRFGRLDILVNNAGITRDNLLMRMSEADWDAVMAVNLRGPFLLCKAALKPMLKQRYGRIVNVASLAGVAGNPGQANYSAAKAGLIALTRSLAREVGSRNITVNAVAPGFIETEILSGLPAEVLERAKQAAAIGRLGTPEEVAVAIRFLALREASYITGAVLGIDGGLAL
jgi:3-oxoacyl-[acyl-carrier protein] reductase